MISESGARLGVVPIEHLENVEHIGNGGTVLMGQAEDQIASFLIEIDEPSQSNCLDEVTIEPDIRHNVHSSSAMVIPA
jgi:hypothetical protein